MYVKILHGRSANYSSKAFKEDHIQSTDYQS